MFIASNFFGMNKTGIDSDAQAFLTAASITDPTITSAIDTLVKGLKSNSIWTKMYAIYPFVGGTSTTHKFNLKNPADTNAAFRLTFGAGIAHSSNGITNNVTGTNAAANTFFTPSTHLSGSNISLTIYQRINIAVGGYDWGGISGTDPNDFEFMLASKSGTQYYGGFGANSANWVTYVNSDARGFYSAGHTGGTTTLYKNGVSVASAARTWNVCANPLGIGSRINSGTPTWDSPANGHAYAFASISDSLDATENSNLYTLVQAFNTTLGRNV